MPAAPTTAGPGCLPAVSDLLKSVSTAGHDASEAALVNALLSGDCGALALEPLVLGKIEVDSGQGTQELRHAQGGGGDRGSGGAALAAAGWCQQALSGLFASRHSPSALHLALRLARCCGSAPGAVLQHACHKARRVLALGQAVRALRCLHAAAACACLPDAEGGEGQVARGVWLDRWSEEGA
jgi:hypothetical protein